MIIAFPNKDKKICKLFIIWNNLIKNMSLKILSYNKIKIQREIFLL
jgi:hypothetical protein